MTTVLQYLVIAAVIAAVLFGIALLVFGRGEQLSPLPARTSPVDLPDRNISGDDVRGVRFALAARGYRMSDVDWALERLADELDRNRTRLAELTRDGADGGEQPDPPDPDQVDLFAEDDLLESAPEQPGPEQPTAEPAAPDHIASDDAAPTDTEPDHAAAVQQTADRTATARPETPAAAAPADTERR